MEHDVNLPTVAWVEVADRQTVEVELTIPTGFGTHRVQNLSRKFPVISYTRTLANES